MSEKAEVSVKFWPFFSRFTTTVTAQPYSNYSEPLPLHFVHHRSNRSDAIPFLFIHGYPGSFLEVEYIINGLVNPSNASLPAFHVGAPSIPGFGFSPTPTGGVILRFLASNHPESVVCALANFWIVPPNGSDLQRYYANETTPDESYLINALEQYENFGSAYQFIQKNQPIQLAYGMADSPVGFTMWIWDLIHGLAGPDYTWTPSELITWAMMYWIQGPEIGLRFYKENYYDGVWGKGTIIGGVVVGSPYPYITQPIAISEFAADGRSRTPLSWAQRSANVVVRTEHDRGGHLAAFITPELLIDDIRSFFGIASLSNTGAFRRR
ncbi:hypothetical protein MMC14_010289 [Varicellaria rhodocarpa]|nr:hypothetical protein [Varicellaria rhodocarpa]